MNPIRLGMAPITLQDVARALQDAAEHGDVEARVDMEMVRLPARRRSEPAKSPPAETFSASDEAEMYRQLAADLGLDEPADEPPMVTISRREFEALKKASDELPELLRERSRPDDWSAEDERQYRQWARSMGLE